MATGAGAGVGAGAGAAAGAGAGAGAGVADAGVCTGFGADGTCIGWDVGFNYTLSLSIVSLNTLLLT